MSNRVQLIQTRSGTIPLVRVQGGPHERGYQRGQQIPDMIHSRVRRVVDSYLLVTSRESVLQVAESMESVIKKRIPEYIDELRGIAAGSGVSWDDLRMAALGRTVQNADAVQRKFQKAEDCCCFVASGPATRNGKLLMGKNGDLLPPVLGKEDLFITQVIPDRGNAWVAAGVFPERPCQPEGMNEKGLTIVGSGQAPKDGLEAYTKGLPTGVPIHHLQNALYQDCATIDEALALLRETPRGYYGRVLFIGDAEGNWVKVEITYDHLRVQYPEPEATFPGNFVAAGISGRFGTPEMAALVTSRAERPSNYVRYDRMMNLLLQNAGSIDLDFAKRFLADHDGTPGATTICKHAENPSLEVMIFSPQERKAWVGKGHPCEADYVEVGLPERD